MTLYDYDFSLTEKYGVIAGVDEAGRGPRMSCVRRLYLLKPSRAQDVPVFPE